MRRRQDDFDEMGYGSQPEKVLFLQLTSARCRLPAQALRCARWRAREMAGPSLVERWHNCRTMAVSCVASASRPPLVAQDTARLGGVSVSGAGCAFKSLHNNRDASPSPSRVDPARCPTAAASVAGDARSLLFKIGKTIWPAASASAQPSHDRLPPRLVHTATSGLLPS